LRTSLGAERRRLIRQLLVEGTVLAGLATLCGVALALATQPVLRAVLPASVPRVGDFGLSAWMLVFGAAAATAVTLLSALAPAFAGTHVRGVAALGNANASAGASAVRWRQSLV